MYYPALQKWNESHTLESILTVAPDLSALLTQYPCLLWYPHTISHASSSDPTHSEGQDDKLDFYILPKHAWKAILHFCLVIQLLNSRCIFEGKRALLRWRSPWEQLILTHFSWRAPQLLNIADMGSKSLREKDDTRRGREPERDKVASAQCL